MKLKEIIPFQYNDVYHFSEGLALVYNDHECGFIDQTGTMKIPCKQGTVPVDNHHPFTHFGTGFKEGLASVSAKVDETLRYGINRRYGFIDKSGNEVIPMQYDAVRDFSCGLAIVGIIDKSLGRDSYGSFGCKWGAINKNGDEVIPIGKYQSVGCYGLRDFSIDNPGVAGTTSDREDRKFHEGMTSILPWVDDSDSPKYGFIDVLGNEIIPVMYTGVNRFRDGLSVVEVIDPEKTGPVAKMASVIDKTGATVIPFKYHRIYDFYDEITVAYNWDPFERFFIDKKGNQPFPFNYSGADPFDEGMAKVFVFANDQTKFGFIDIHGQEIVPCKYDNAMPYYDGIAIVGMGDYYYGMEGAVDKQGREFIPCIYNSVR
jgi:hypothetical protein